MLPKLSIHLIMIQYLLADGKVDYFQKNTMKFLEKISQKKKLFYPGEF